MKQKLILILFLLPVLAFSQPVSFEASTDARQVVLGNYFEITFTLNNANGSDFRPPSFGEYKILSGPNQSVRTTMVNGQVTRSIAYSYYLQPRRVGKATVDEASIRVSGKILKTKPVTVEVVSAPPASQNNVRPTGKEAFFIRAEPGTTEARVGQQIILDYKLYTTVDIQTFNLVSESDYKGFFTQEVSQFQARVQREVVNGKSYATKILRRIALFPQQEGALSISPMTLQVGVSEPNGNEDPFGGFFFNGSMHQVTTQTNSVRINVKPLPENPPATFTGAVGHFSFNSSLGSTRITTDDALSLRVNISGNGDIKRVQPPVLNLPEGYEVYDPKTVNENTFDSQGEIGWTKELEYLILPKVTGTLHIEPAFTYFDTDKNQYVTLKAQSYNVEVLKGNNPAGSISGSQNQAGVNGDIRYIKQKAFFFRERRAFFGSGLFWLMLSLPLLALGGVIGWKRIELQRSRLDISILRSRKARDIAQKRLAVAKSHLVAGNSRPFFDEISRALFGYFGDKLNIPMSEFSKETVRTRMQEHGVSEALIEQFIGILQTCEIALFGGQDNAETMQDTYRRSEGVIRGVEAELK